MSPSNPKPFQGDIYQGELDSHAKAHLLTTSDLAKYYHLPINEAAKEMDICTSVLKKICRKQGIKRWPHRKFKSLDRLISSLDDKEQVEQLKQKRELLLCDPNIEYTAIIPKSKLNSCNSFISKVKGPTKTIKKEKPTKLTKKVPSPLPFVPVSISMEVNTKVSSPKPVPLFAQLPFLKNEKAKNEELPETKPVVHESVKQEYFIERKLQAVKVESSESVAPAVPEQKMEYYDDATEEDENIPMEINDCKLEASTDGDEMSVIVNKVENMSSNMLLRTSCSNSAIQKQEMTEAPRTVKYKEQLKLSTNSLAQFNAILADCKSFISYGRVL